MKNYRLFLSGVFILFANTNLVVVCFPTQGVQRSSSTVSSSPLHMASNDGKKRRKKQVPSTSSSSSSPAPPSPPPRVSNDINIPIRRQIQYGKLNKEFRQSSGTSSFRQTNGSNRSSKVQRTKYRRTWDQEQIEQKALERKRKGQDPNWDVILNQTHTAPPLVLVDGYNIIHSWPRLKKHMLKKNDVARARQLLVDDLENLQSLKGWRVEVVFDGASSASFSSFSVYGTSNNNQKKNHMANKVKAASKQVTKHGVRVVFTGSGVEADSYIEERCADAKVVTEGKVGTNTLIVCTNDAMIRLAGTSAGALCMSADRLVTELKAVNKAMAYRVEAAMAKVNGGTIRPEKLWGTTRFSSVAAPYQPLLSDPTVTMGSSSDSDNSIDSDSDENSHNVTRATPVPEPPAIPGLQRGLQQTQDGKTIYTGRFGRGAVLIEDRRRRKNKTRKDGG